jgi:hypothetical protein
MKKLLPIILFALAAVVGLPVLIGGATWLAYRDNRMKCDSPVPRSRLEALGVAIPADAPICRESPNPSGATFDIRIDAPGPLCLASFQNVGCTSLTKAGLSFVAPMADAGWDTGKSDVATSGDSATFYFHRGADMATLSLAKSRYGEVTGFLQVSAAGKKKGKKAKGADEE